MNRNQVKGAAKEVAGKVQKAVGQMTSSSTQEAKGAAKVVKGKMQKKAGDIEQAVEKATRKTR
jgi:uncharacterized protein YjbJ (UPF0337 family)